MSLGYLGLVAIFIAMVASCFAFALSELRHPRDPGPLPIDITRDIHHGYFARLLRRAPAPATDIVAGAPSHTRRVTPRKLSSGGVASREGESYLISGDGSVAAGARIDSIVCEGTATIGAAAHVAEHAEGVTELLLDIAAVVHGRATSDHRIVLSPDARVSYAAAPLIRTTGGPAPVAPEPLPPWDAQMDADLEWLLSNGTPIDRAIKDLAAGSGRQMCAVDGIRRAEASVLGASEAIALHGTSLAPTWLGAMHAWYLGAGTVRVRGDVILPPGAIVPFHLIVEGVLAAGSRVLFHGSIHAWDRLALSDECRVEGSLTGRGDVSIGNGVVVGGCVQAGGDAIVGSGCVLGTSANGGIASSGTIQIGPGTTIANKIYAERGARVRALSPQPATL